MEKGIISDHRAALVREPLLGELTTAEVIGRDRRELGVGHEVRHGSGTVARLVEARVARWRALAGQFPIPRPTRQGRPCVFFQRAIAA